MPNGRTKNWIRFCAAIEGFRARYRAWPKLVRMHPGMLSNFESLLAPAALAAIRAKVALVADHTAGVIAEDAEGRTYDYGAQRFPDTRPDITAYEWLGVRPDLKRDADA